MKDVSLFYVLLSSAPGMQQYAAGLANQQAAPTVVVPNGASIDRFAPHVCIHAFPVGLGAGLQTGSLRFDILWRVYRGIVECHPDVVHITGPHLWNPILLYLLNCSGIPTVHTIHDTDPHSGAKYGRLLYVWNALVLCFASHVLVHGRVYMQRAIARGMPPDKIACAPLLHLFVGYAAEQRLAAVEDLPCPSSSPFALFFARLETYKGLGVLVQALRSVESVAPYVRAIVAGKGDFARLVAGPLPGNIEVRNRVIEDDEAIDLFSRCSLVVLPYIDATQSALIGAAYFFGKPVIVTRAGALPEYVVEGETGWVIPPRDPQALAECLQAALGDPDRLARMGRAGRAWYDAQRIVERETLDDMYARVAARGRK